MSVNETGVECRECGCYHATYICTECLDNLLNDIQDLMIKDYDVPTELAAFRELRARWDLTQYNAM